MYAVRLDEERVIQGLAMAMILVLLAMAVMPAIMQVDGILVVAYVLNAINDKKFAAGSCATTVISYCNWTLHS